MFKRGKTNKTELAVYGQEMVHEFASAIANAAVANGLKYEAERNEELALQNIASVGAGNSIHVTPQDIPVDQQAYIAKASVDAHMQKVQALQVAAYTDQQVHLAELSVKEKYRDKKVTAQVLITDPWPVDTCWRDNYNRYHINQHGPKKVSGVIEDIDLRQNFIIIRPSKLSHVVNNTIEFHRVYIIKPDTMQPMVTLSFS
jgi:hypothetical protein